MSPESHEKSPSQFVQWNVRIPKDRAAQAADLAKILGISKAQLTARALELMQDQFINPETIDAAVMRIQEEANTKILALRGLLGAQEQQKTQPVEPGSDPGMQAAPRNQELVAGLTHLSQRDAADIEAL